MSSIVAHASTALDLATIYRLLLRYPGAAVRTQINAVSSGGMDPDLVVVAVLDHHPRKRKVGHQSFDSEDQEAPDAACAAQEGFLQFLHSTTDCSEEDDAASAMFLSLQSAPRHRRKGNRGCRFQTSYRKTSRNLAISLEENRRCQHTPAAGRITQIITGPTLSPKRSTASCYIACRTSRRREALLVAILRQGIKVALFGKEKKPATMDDDDRVDTDEIEVNSIEQYLSDKVMFNIMEEESAKDLWEKRRKLCMGKNLANKLDLKKQLYGLKMEEGCDVLEHMNTFNRP
ncbi:hypothetical protein MRB53_009772 [Persea americana]|uniref:Uncharacterized protein n=1 Tax=Persea americana TaxID=3435 RepID=A0ACC2LPX9_PERAE|nr:hypothetical protein MRB53_009772 [Persea americana]